MARTYTPVVYDGYDEMTRRRGGRAAYRKSLRANIKCAAEMRKVCGEISRTSTSAGREDLNDSMDRIFRKFGKERCDLVLATTISRNAGLVENFRDVRRPVDTDMNELFSIDDFRVSALRYARKEGVTDHKGVETKERDGGTKYYDALNVLVKRYVAFEDAATKFPRPKKGVTVKGSENITYEVPAVALIGEKGGRKTFRVPQAGQFEDRDWCYSVPSADCREIKDAKGKPLKYAVTLPVNSDVKLVTAKKASEDKAPRPVWVKAENFANTLYYQNDSMYGFGRGSKAPRIGKLESRLIDRLNIAVNNQVSGEEMLRLMNGEDVCRDMGLSQKKLMDRLAFWYEGKTDDMAKVYKASPLCVDMKDSDIKKLAEKSCEHTHRRYNDWRAEVAERKEERAERKAAREAQREAQTAKATASPSNVVSDYVTIERSTVTQGNGAATTYTAGNDDIYAEPEATRKASRRSGKTSGMMNETMKDAKAVSDMTKSAVELSKSMEDIYNAFDAGQDAMNDIKKNVSGSSSSHKGNRGKGDDGKGGM